MVLCVKGSAEERGRIEVPKVTHRVRYPDGLEQCLRMNEGFACAPAFHGSLVTGPPRPLGLSIAGTEHILHTVGKSVGFLRLAVLRRIGVEQMQHGSVPIESGVLILPEP